MFKNKRSKSAGSSRRSSISGKSGNDNRQDDAQLNMDQSQQQQENVILDQNNDSQGEDRSGGRQPSRTASRQQSRPPSGQRSRPQSQQRSRPNSRNSRKASRAPSKQQSRASSARRSRPNSQDSIDLGSLHCDSDQDTGRGERAKKNWTKRPTLEQIKMINRMENHPMGRIFSQVIRTANEAAVQGQFAAGPKKDINPKTIDVYEIAELFSSLNSFEENKFEDVTNNIRSIGALVADLQHEMRKLQRSADEFPSRFEAIEINNAQQAAKTAQIETKQDRVLRDIKEGLNDMTGHNNAVYDNPLFQISVPAPRYFPDEKKIVSTKDLTEAYKLFPKSGAKFSGDKNSTTVVEFLELMNEIQSFLKLSEDEFKKRFLASTTGKAHELVSHWLEQDMDVPQIYHNMMLQFDKGDTALTANQKLRSFKAYKNKNSAEVEAAIQQIALRACRIIPKGDARKCLFDTMCINAYLDALPHESSLLVRTKYIDLSMKLKRQPTFAELSRNLDGFRPTIDTDIARNGITGRDNSDGGKGKGKGNAKYVNLVHSQPTDSTQPNEEENSNWEGQQQWKSNNNNWKQKGFNQGGMKNSRQELNQDSNQNSQQTQDDQQQGGEHNGQQGEQQMQQEWDQGQQKQQPPKGGPPKRGKWCSLCGHTTHNASDGCYMIRDPVTGRVIECTPCHGDCARCHMGLKHPEDLCPYANLVLAMAPHLS